MKTLTPALAAIGLAACAVAGRPLGTPAPPAKMFAGSYINVKAPDSVGWYLIQSSDTVIAFGKPGHSKGESFAATVQMLSLALTDTPAAFEEVVKVGVRQDSPPERF